MESYVFDFEKSPTFFQKWNKEFDIETMGTDSFRFVLANTNCPDNIEDCLNSSNQLNLSSGDIISVTCNLEYEVIDNDNANIVLNGEVTVSFENDFPMKAAFLTTSTGYVIGYSINQMSINITNRLILEDGLTFYSISEGAYHV